MKAHKAPPRKRRIIAHGDASAADMIGPLDHGCEIFGLTGGQFSFIDVLEHCLNEIGPARCVIATWTASYANVEKAVRFTNDNRLLSCRWLVDSRFAARKPELCDHIIERHGPGSIKTGSSHAKFSLLKNEKWSLVIRTSMNLNENPRVENFEISDDPALLEYIESTSAGMYAGEYKKRDENERKDLPLCKAKQSKLQMKTGLLSLDL